MAAVFLSYRRGDSEGQARALSLELGKLLGTDSVFMDVDGIALGRDFRKILHERLEACAVMFVLIGPGWIDAVDSAGNRRLENPADFVRQEIAAALKRDIPVIPVLLQGASMPSAERLPDDIQELSYRNGFELGHSTWESDVRELVKRLGLQERRHPAAGVATPAPSVERTPTRSAAPWKGRPLAAAALAAGIAGIGLLIYLSPGRSTSGAATVSSDPAAATALASAGITQNALTPAFRSDSSTAAPGSVIELDWPGGDCWDIFRGAELVTYQCGARRQALGPGTYTVKARHAPVFAPFEVVVEAGAPTRVNLGGTVDFRWPGGDCWDILRGVELVTYQCGAKQQALEAGTYTIKGKHAPVFTPFQIEIRNGFSTRIEKGGTFAFDWPGGDCWDILRGAELVTYQCGSKQQALAAGSYTIKGRHAPVFDPFEIQIADGAVVKAP